MSFQCLLHYHYYSCVPKIRNNNVIVAYVGRRDDATTNDESLCERVAFERPPKVRRSRPLHPLSRAPYGRRRRRPAAAAVVASAASTSVGQTSRCRRLVRPVRPLPRRSTTIVVTAAKDDGYLLLLLNEGPVAEAAAAFPCSRYEVVVAGISKTNVSKEIKPYPVYPRACV